MPGCHQSFYYPSFKAILSCFELKTKDDVKYDPQLIYEEINIGIPASFCLYLIFNICTLKESLFLSKMKQPLGRDPSLYMVVVHCLHSTGIPIDF